MSTKWTLSPRRESSEVHVHQVLLVQGVRPPRVMSTKCSWSKAHPPRLPFPKMHVIRGTHLPSNGFASQVSSSKGIRPPWDTSTEIMKNLVSELRKFHFSRNTSPEARNLGNVVTPLLTTQ
ncbi:hypothetical protein ACOSQ3_033295 [Xanthoceras sorbifolium]